MVGRSKGKIRTKGKLVVINAKKRPYNNPGQAGFLSGNPGRPEGSVNKFTRIKEQLAEVFEEIKGKDMTKTFAQSGNRNFARFLDHIVALASKQNHDGPSASVVNIIYGYRTKPNGSSVRNGSRKR